VFETAMQTGKIAAFVMADRRRWSCQAEGVQSKDRPFGLAHRSSRSNVGASASSATRTSATWAARAPQRLRREVVSPRPRSTSIY